MDFTVILLMIFALLALQTGQTIIAAGLALLLVFTSHSKSLLTVVLLGGGIAAMTVLGDQFPSWMFIGGLFIVFLFQAKDDKPQPEGGYPPQGYY